MVVFTYVEGGTETPKEESPMKREDYEFLIEKAEKVVRDHQTAVDVVEGVDNSRESVMAMKLAEARMEGFFDGIFAASRDSCLAGFVRQDAKFRMDRDRILDLS
jgi:hypothetical protein